MINATKPTGEKCYEYILCYVDYLLCISHNTNNVMNDIQCTLKFKNDKVETNDFYLESKLKKKYLGEKEIWIMSRTTYTKSAAENIEEQLRRKRE